MSALMNACHHCNPMCGPPTAHAHKLELKGLHSLKSPAQSMQLYLVTFDRDCDQFW